MLQFFASEIKYSSQFSYAFLYRSKWAADGAYSDIFENGDYFNTTDHLVDLTRASTMMGKRLGTH